MKMEAGVQFPWIPETPVKSSPNRQKISNRDDNSTSSVKLDFDILNLGDENDASAGAANNQVPNAPSQCDDGNTSHDELKTLNPPSSKKRRGDNKKKGSNNNGQHTKLRKKIYRPRILVDESLDTKKVGKKSQPKVPKTPKKKKTPSRTPKPSTPTKKKNQPRRAPSCKLSLLPLLNDEGRASLPFLGNNVNKFDQEYFDFESSICKNALGSQYNLLETYQKLASFSSSCLMHSRQVGANFPSMCRRKRMKRIRARLEKYLTPFKKGLRSKIFIRKKKSCLEKFTIERLTTTKKEMKSLIRRIRSLKRMKKSRKTKGKNDQLVLYEEGLGGDRMLVPYKGHDPNNKKLRVEVALDEETLRVWNLIMDGKTHEDSDDLKQQQWERERFAYKCKVGVFMIKMHELQGSREFSPWKGSVLDSVIGAYLTQNVSDHLSSSAYMSLAARFPIKSSTTDLCIEDVPRIERIQFIESSAIFPGDKLTEELEKIKVEEMVSRDVKEEPFKSNNKEEETRGKLLKEVDKETRERWDKLRKEYGKSTRHSDHDDSVDWEAVRCADVKEIATAIAGRGQHNVIAERIKSLLNELHDSYGDLDLEWLRYAPPTEAKRCLLDIYGLGLKSVECIRLLTLQNKAFPVDVNVGRIAVRLGWVPLQPLPEETQIHNLEKYPLFDNIQKYLWPRLCHLLPKDLYQLHYHLITFGKVFCTKKNPNCNACPMSTNCEHFKSAFASAQSLPGTTSRQPTKDKIVTDNLLPMPIFEVNQSSTTTKYQTYRECEPIIEMPSSPEAESERIYMLEFEANNEEEDYHVSDEANKEEEDYPSPDDEKILVMNLSSQSKETHNHSAQEDKNHMNISASLVTLPYTGSMPAPKMKNASRLRTERLVYVLNDGHPLLTERTPLEPGDPSPYSLVIWSADELEKSNESIMNNMQEKDSVTVPGTLLIPCRTAMRGRFPLNGTYFQVNEVFADYDSMKNPIDVPRTWLWHLEKRIAYFGAGASSILKGLSADEIKDCFWKGYVCVRAIDAKTGAPRPLSYRFHRNTTVKAKTENKTTQEKEVKTDKTTQEKEDNPGERS
ncbi:hypothetical protein Ahy_A08g039443 [Arachis hypogaea]|uniref:HhH-GPD domain-containing protein n=1 Tax=Arachis hypogaea TaxID=3818 RepID=A0A445BWA2_ARAHY|nr:hypothetical protein Ahy_A08g039443 [Arachis hypogaea]